MRRPAFKLLCYFICMVQVLAVSGFAPGASVCLHADGTSKIEGPAELAECHAKQDLRDAEADALAARECVDSPVVAEATSQSKVAANGSGSLTVQSAQIALPAFVARLDYLFEKPRATHLTLQTQRLPDVERASLGTVILVI